MKLLEVATSSSPIWSTEEQSWLERYMKACAGFTGPWGQVNAAMNGHDVVTPQYVAKIGLWGPCGKCLFRVFKQGVVSVMNAWLSPCSRPSSHGAGLSAVMSGVHGVA